MDQQVRRRRPGRARRGGTRPSPPAPARARWGSGRGCRRSRELPVADPVAERPAALVRHLPRLDREALGLELARARAMPNVQFAAQPAGRDREVRRGHAPGQHVRRARRRPAAGSSSAGPGVVAVAGREERQPVDVIPVQVGEQDRAGERRGPPSSGVTRRRPVPASSTSAGPAASSWRDAPRTRCGRRSGGTPRPARGSSRGHRRGVRAPSASAGVFAPVPPGQLHQRGAVELAGVHRRHPARGDRDQRRRCGSPPSRCARSPSIAPGPYSASRSPSRSTRITPSRMRKIVAARLALADQHVARRAASDPRLGGAVHELHGQLVAPGPSPPR